jgi:hypothetical protein
MPIFKGQASKATPIKAVNYVTDPKKASITTSLYLDDNRDYAQQFQDTADYFHKAQTPDSRKYYHFKLSFSPEDNITAEMAHKIAVEQAERLFKGYECVLSTHTDKAHIHTHIVVNSVSFETGKMLQVSPQQYGRMKDLANTFAEEHGYSTVDFRKPAKNKVTTQEQRIILKGGTSWKEELREVINEAKRQTSNMTEFEAYLKENYGVLLTRNTEKTIAYKHPDKEKAIRGEKLGADYTKGAILSEFEKLKDRADPTRTRGTGQTARSRSLETDNNGVTSGVASSTAISREVEQRKQGIEQANNVINTADNDVKQRKPRIIETDRERETARREREERESRRQESRIGGR